MGIWSYVKYSCKSGLKVLPGHPTCSAPTPLVCHPCRGALRVTCGPAPSTDTPRGKTRSENTGGTASHGWYQTVCGSGAREDLFQHQIFSTILAPEFESFHW